MIVGAAGLSGRTLGERYHLEAVLGQGGMSTVYRGRDERLGRPVAVKVIGYPPDATAAQREELRQRFRHEAAAAAQIPPHPNVVQVYDYGTDLQLDLDYIVMQLLQGRDLKDAMARTGIGVSEGLEILLGAARGVAAGHRAGLVHRDIKPANIFLLDDAHGGGVRVVDFGIAKALHPSETDDLTRTGFAPYTPRYASPEQLAGHPVTPASDVYQLGLVGRELLAGAPPPTPLDELLQRALHLDPAQRFRDAGEFADALAGLTSGPALAPTDLADHTVLANGTEWVPMGVAAPPAPRTERRMANPRVVRLAVACALAVLALWGITRLAGGRGSETEPADVGRIEAEFRDLQSRAAERLERQREE